MNLEAPILVKISDLKTNPKNPRLIKDERFRKLVQSLKDFPEMLEKRPIVVNEGMVVLGGNMRLKAAKESGMKELPVIIAKGWTQEQQDEFVIKDNVGFGEWDWQDLQLNWDVPKLEDWGLELPEIKVEDPEAQEDDFEIPEQVTTSIVLGDIIEIGRHRLMCGDSGNSEHIERLMNGELADMMFTDPPYGVAYVGKTKDALTIENDSTTPEELKDLVTAWFSCADLALRGGAYALATVPAGPLHIIFAQDWLDRGWLRQIMVWNKSAMVMGHSEYHYKHEPILFGWKPGGERLKNTDRTKTTVWDFDKPSANREHPTMKPVKMWAYGIKNHTKPGMLVYEPFGGSGTAMVACEETNRRCNAIELDPKYCQVIIDRMLKLDPNIEVKINGEKYNA